MRAVRIFEDLVREEEDILAGPAVADVLHVDHDQVRRDKSGGCPDEPSRKEMFRNEFLCYRSPFLITLQNFFGELRACRVNVPCVLPDELKGPPSGENLCCLVASGEDKITVTVLPREDGERIVLVLLAEPGLALAERQFSHLALMDKARRDDNALDPVNPGEINSDGIYIHKFPVSLSYPEFSGGSGIFLCYHFLEIGHHPAPVIGMDKIEGGFS